MRLKQLKNFFLLEKEESDPIVAQLIKDSQFLQELKFMDYSLLLGIRKFKKETAF